MSPPRLGQDFLLALHLGHIRKHLFPIEDKPSYVQVIRAFRGN